MALAQICRCGHTKTDHMGTNRKGELTRYHCEWFDCSCKAFIFAKKMSMNQGFVQLPTLIDCNSPPPKKKDYNLEDCDSDGKLSDFITNMTINSKKFNNGEYP